MGNTSSSSLPDSSHHVHIANDFKVLQCLGEGGFGIVVKCLKQDTGEIVALKVPVPDEDLRREALMMRFLMEHNLDKFNIIKYNGKVSVSGQTSLVFELLDITLQDYLLTLEDFMTMEEIKSVIQQMSTALDALDRVGVIHTDIKTNNILLVDHHKKPIRVKLIDFGLAIFQFQTKPGSTHQTTEYRAPEILLGLPFTGAIDIWSLGSVMAVMMFGAVLFPATVEYEALQYIIDLIGPPPAHLIKNGRKTSLFYKKNDSGEWIFKTPAEVYHTPYPRRDSRTYKFCSLNEAKGLRTSDIEDDEEWSESIELLTAMLKWDDKERITAAGILNHPFITRGNTSDHLTCPEAAVTVVQPVPRLNRADLEEPVNRGRNWCQQYCCCFPSSSHPSTSIDSEEQEDSDWNNVTSFSK